VAEPDFVGALIANEPLEQLEDYLKRGRPFAGEKLQKLRTRWIALMRAWANSTERVDHREREDIQAEMTMRKVEPPFAQVRDAMKILRRKSDEALRDPVRARRVEAELSEKIDQFAKAIKRSKGRKPN
jgi:hypothetical protein